MASLPPCLPPTRKAMEDIGRAAPADGVAEYLKLATPPLPDGTASLRSSAGSRAMRLGDRISQSSQQQQQPRAPHAMQLRATLPAPQSAKKPSLPSAARGHRGAGGSDAGSGRAFTLAGRRKVTTSDLYVHRQRHDDRMAKLQAFDF
jgi:hypothetical protein